MLLYYGLADTASSGLSRPLAASVVGRSHVTADGGFCGRKTNILGHVVSVPAPAWASAAPCSTSACFSDRSSSAFLIRRHLLMAQMDKQSTTRQTSPTPRPTPSLIDREMDEGGKRDHVLGRGAVKLGLGDGHLRVGEVEDHVCLLEHAAAEYICDGDVQYQPVGSIELHDDMSGGSLDRGAWYESTEKIGTPTGTGKKPNVLGKSGSQRLYAGEVMTPSLTKRSAVGQDARLRHESAITRGPGLNTAVGGSGGDQVRLASIRQMNLNLNRSHGSPGSGRKKRRRPHDEEDRERVTDDQQRMMKMREEERIKKKHKLAWQKIFQRDAHEKRHSNSP
ncbi:uncharacterized protein LY79DRAFT_581376 [Colletotrichum navitas]|uniref:Uncharacterized protein n=1 Tax=Colletotrichum navitas TaxID=681940 RepID=A0AAD8PUI4_9PEZI|nr:uncharacterized protein LY79DRAFT_581376 [Colletotrichum navitas]KAK1584914.1 hypothetical protein LY79DRAFT_581376 [Colletotrichum navitas]